MTSRISAPAATRAARAHCLAARVALSWLVLVPGTAPLAGSIDLTYPPAGEEAPRVHVERGERNRGRVPAPEEAPRDHVIIGPDFSVRAPAASSRQEPSPAPPEPPQPLQGPVARSPADAGRGSSAAPGGGNALLWRVRPPGGPVSHLFGTIHLEDPRVTRLPGPVEAAFRDAGTVVLEARLDQVNPLALAGRMMLADGRTLEQVAGADLYGSARELLARQGVPALVAQRLQPWAAAIILSVPRPRSGLFLDQVLAQRAREAGKTLRGLERLEEQLDALAGMTPDQQISLLREAVGRYEQLPGAVEQMVSAYLDRDLQRLAALGRRYGPADAGLASTFEERLIASRNRRMAQRVQPMLDAGATFVAVGALHLAGPDGLPRLLAREGYDVEPVY